MICKLPDHVANQIAAGEVVERPVAVIKELVENAVDAGATRIDIEYRQAGKSLMRVSDNGCGMDRDDAVLSLQRHATSKIRDVSDILAIHSFGFRGEALPSIASVSRFSLRTRRPMDEVGTEIIVQGGQIARVADCGMAAGTVVEVAQLFATVPARRKFLRTDKTESAHIVQYARLAAIAHPEVAFTLVEDGRTVWQSPACASVRERIGEIFGRPILKNLLPIKAVAAGDMQLNGYIGKPSAARPNRNDIYCFVNLRPVDSRLLTHVLLESYHSYVPRNRYPMAFLYLTVAPHLVDVNVHPAKKEVRFQSEGNVRNFVMEAVLAVLRADARQLPVGAVRVESETIVAPPAALVPAVRPPIAPPTPEVRPSPDLAAVQSDKSVSSKSVAQGFDRNISHTETKGADNVVLPSAGIKGDPDWRLMGVLRNRLAVFESPIGLVQLFIPAARERVLYEEILASIGDSGRYSQEMLFAVPIEFDPVSAALMEEHLSFFSELGFAVEPFGRTIFRLRAVPAWFSPDEGEDFVRELLAKIRERGLRPGKSDEAREQVARLAAARAARQSFQAKSDALRPLVQRLFACRQPLQDPRGRPTFTEVPFAELEKPFV
ncbi:MAG: DNA mismatch repair endonuclease MutL [Verrucomicrobia bacterium]|nr:DNA mismatch repair endonuclease MutL [Verrucomicrobiota bacterium]